MPVASITAHWLPGWLSGGAPPVGPTSAARANGADALAQAGTKVLVGAGTGTEVKTY
jgi:hypothetical protein